MRGVKRLALMAVLTAAALIIFTIEAQIPSLVPVPGVKLGLANIITLVAVYLLSRKEAGLILLMRIILGAVFAGSPSTFLFSSFGGLLAWIVMCFLKDRIVESRIWLISVFSALAHNLGQIIVCVLVVKTPGIFIYLPVLIASGIITGSFTGFAAMYLIRAIRKIKL
ncbi:MAG: Gx transporter family protein [Oscillospiraceae bacterium]|nr:Gx transporter family protein [Oscillospiraceae bacterium]